MGNRKVKNVLVTGGAGFIGSHTCVALAEAGYQPVVVDNFANSQSDVPDRIAQIIGTAIPVHQVDCTDETGMRNILDRYEDWHGVIHFAAYKAVGESVAHPLKYYRNNIGSLLTLLQLMNDYPLHHLVFSSSCTVYGEPDHLPVTEKSPVRPAESPYGYTKQVGEQIITDQQQVSPAMRSVLLRYFNPIGAHPSGKIGELPLGKPENLVPYVVQTAAGWRDQLTIFGRDYPTEDGTAIRDYIHVMDLAEAHVKALDWLHQQEAQETPGIFNIGTGRGHSVKEVVDTFEDATGIKVPHQFGSRRPGDVSSIYADATLAQRELNWSASRTLGEALHDAWMWQQTLKPPA